MKKNNLKIGIFEMLGGCSTRIPRNFHSIIILIVFQYKNPFTKAYTLKKIEKVTKKLKNGIDIRLGNLVKVLTFLKKMD